MDMRSDKDPKNARSEDRRIPKPLLDMLLRNPIRKQALEQLEENPGMNKRRLAQALGVSVSGLDFHLDRLEQAGLVITRASQSGRETLCFTPENVRLWDDPSTRMLFGTNAPIDVALYLTQRPCASAAEIAKELDVSVHTARRHLRNLEDQELVQRMRVDRQVYFHAEPRLKDWVENHGPAGMPEPGLRS